MCALPGLDSMLVDSYHLLLLYLGLFVPLVNKLGFKKVFIFCFATFLIKLKFSISMIIIYLV